MYLKRAVFTHSYTSNCVVTCFIFYIRKYAAFFFLRAEGFGEYSTILENFRPGEFSAFTLIIISY